MMDRFPRHSRKCVVLPDANQENKNKFRRIKRLLYLSQDMRMGSSVIFRD